MTGICVGVPDRAGTANVEGLLGENIPEREMEDKPRKGPAKV